MKRVEPFTPTMKPLVLNSLPTQRADELSPLLMMEREGFVDEAVVTALLRSHQPGRRTADPEDLALTADDLDFAGWRLSKEIPVRAAEVPPRVIDAIVRRAAPPATHKPVRGSAGSLRKWRMAAVALLSRLGRFVKRSSLNRFAGS